MKAKKINIVITRNLGNYENVKLEAEYELSENDNLTDSFVKGKADLLEAFSKMFRSSHRNMVQAWNTNEPQQVQKSDTVKLERLELGTQKLDAVCLAIHQGRMDVAGLSKFFVLGEGVKEYLDKYF